MGLNDFFGKNTDNTMKSMVLAFLLEFEDNQLKEKNVLIDQYLRLSEGFLTVDSKKYLNFALDHISKMLLENKIKIE